LCAIAHQLSQHVQGDHRAHHGAIAAAAEGHAKEVCSLPGIAHDKLAHGFIVDVPQVVFFFFGRERPYALRACARADAL
jgi:hypothetical protein